ncbi:Lanosterol 14-alpha-demethylase [Cladochytrium tenue]|nr:Lanosterol 14-alpha-demethylase [Cladochytrium tenue]
MASLLDTPAVAQAAAFASANPGLTVGVSLLVLAVTAYLWSLASAAAAERAAAAAAGRHLPPLVPSPVPFVGNAIEYGVDPVRFLQGLQDKYGDCFTFVMAGRKMTFCMGADGNFTFFNVKLKEATAEGAYATLTVPIFGKEVVYDVDNAVFMEQKKFIKDALTTNAFRSYMPIIEAESKDFYASHFKFPSDDAEITTEIFHQMSEMIIRTASHCLMGKEVRQKLREGIVAKLYKDLDRGFAPINVFFSWLPLPSYINRDRANKEMTRVFTEILRERRAKKDEETHNDVLQALLVAKYKDGTPLTDAAISHILIALLMGGQHTSSTTSSWILFELARRPDIVAELLKEQSMVLTGKPDTPPHKLPSIDYDSLRSMKLLNSVMMESLRLHAPIHTIMRKVESPVVNGDVVIPAGHFICASPQVSQLDPTRFPDPTRFDPYRHIAGVDTTAEWTIGGVDVAQKSARSHFLPFGAGRHRCIGEAFAYVQNKLIVSLFLRDYEISLPKDPKTGEPVFPQADYTSLIVVPKEGSMLNIKKRRHA